MNQMLTATLGYPRIGENREWSVLLEQYWSGTIGEKELLDCMAELRLKGLNAQRKAGIDWIASGDFSLYDHMLDAAAMFGLVPERFAYAGGPVSTELYFAMARGTDGAAACRKADWFGTGYHYVVPELGGREPSLTVNKPLAAYAEAKRMLGLETAPVLVGPYSFVKLADRADGESVGHWIGKLAPLYGQVLADLAEAGAVWVQLEEPCLGGEMSSADWEAMEKAYAVLRQAAQGLRIMLQIPYAPAEHYGRLTGLPVNGIGLDFVAGKEKNLASVMAHGVPAGWRLGIGLIDGQGVWRTDLRDAARLVTQLAKLAGESCELALQPSCSLLHVPVSLAGESGLPPHVKETLAFADEKLDELVTLKRALCRIGTAALAAEEKMHESALAARRRYLLPKRGLPAESGWVQKMGADCMRKRIS
jgi:5-methyltetrahydropteroyltriglutamate--homocysteine methyltransferase